MGRIAILWLIVLGAHAHADDKPWAVGVSDVQIKTAETLLAEGNALFVDKRYADALDRYTKAIASWDHPAIRFNVVRCLIQLGRNVEAFDNLALALKYGAAPLEAPVYDEALTYKKLLERQVGEIAVSCTQPNVKVTLDGQPLMTCPGDVKKRVDSGNHQLVAIRDGFLTKTHDLVIAGGRKDVQIELAPVAVTQRWKPWKPWAVVLAGVALAGIGGVFRLAAGSEFDKYEADVTRFCMDTGCNDTPGNHPGVPRTHERRGDAFNGLAVGAWITGAVGVAAGGVLVYLNRSHPGERARVSVTPSTSGASVSIEARF